MRQRPAVLHRIKDQRIDRGVSQRRGVMHVADEFTPEDPEVVHVSANSLSGELEDDELMEKGPEALDDLLAERNVFREPHPTLRPLVEILAGQPRIDRTGGGLRLGHGVRYRTALRLPLPYRHGTDHDSKPVLSVSGIRL